MMTATLSPTLRTHKNYSKQALRYITLSKAENTLRAYQSDWEDFVTWCSQRGERPLPATVESLVEYFSYLADFIKANTISRRATSISTAHKMAGYTSPLFNEEVRMTLQGIRRANGTHQQGKNPIMWADLEKVSEVFPEDTPLGLRSRALLLLCFAGAFRRSEVVSLDVEDLTFIPGKGLKVLLRHSKNDPEGKGQYKGIAYRKEHLSICPVTALRKWLDVAGITRGPIFRSLTRRGNVRNARLSDKAVVRTVKEFAELTGADPAKYAGHSLRRGFATSAALAGAQERHIMKQTGHHCNTMVRRYIDESELFTFDNMELMESNLKRKGGREY
nr:site-specific integrase [uncultured Anaeromusa sp.]